MQPLIRVLFQLVRSDSLPSMAVNEPSHSKLPPQCCTRAPFHFIESTAPQHTLSAHVLAACIATSKMGC